MNIASLSGRSHRLVPPLITVLVLLGACQRQDGILTPRLEPPRDLAASYDWQLASWQNGEAIGAPRVQLNWAVPQGWQGDPFRVYARRGTGAYALIATVTSCGQGACTYLDANVRGGERYDYYVASVDERSGQEAESGRAQINVPTFTQPAAPADLVVTGLDAMSFLRWRQPAAQRFRVLLQVGQDYFDLGETDSQSFLDDRAENGVEHRYLVAAIDTLGHFSRLSSVGIGVPRPDYHAEILYPHEVRAEESGFRFVAAPATEDPVVSGNSPLAQWRVETIDGLVSIRPLGATRMTQGTFTTALSCGPGAEADCLDVREAPADVAFGTAPAAAQSAYTYVFRLQSPDGRTRFAKARIIGSTRDTAGRTVLIFDWAYQLRPDDRRLDQGWSGSGF
ncbi:hypothetical protein BH23GEM6_BH23GEM6_14200 [soil metagenome]